jgi:hypothetical protein
MYIPFALDCLVERRLVVLTWCHVMVLMRCGCLFCWYVLFQPRAQTISTVLEAAVSDLTRSLTVARDASAVSLADLLQHEDGFQVR